MGLGAEKSTQEPRTWDGKRVWTWVIGFVSVAFVVFQLYTAGFGQYPNLIQRSTHAGFGLVLSFLILPGFTRAGRGRTPGALDVALAVVAGVLCFYITPNYDRLMESIGLEAATYEVVMGALLILLVMESARRATGPILPLIALTGIGYALLGGFIPGNWGHPGFSFQYVIEFLYLGPEGLWGTLTGISATLVAAFIIFGAILLTTGGAESFMKMALVVGGRSHGGAAKVATVASALFGMLSGSAIANVATTGNFTIPMMKRLGYRSSFAGAVEATASSGGQITPPIMGAGAFIMSELISRPYLEIALAACLPALVFFACVWFSIDLEARKVDLKRVPPEEIPPFRAVFNWKTSGAVGITIVVLLVSLFMGHTPTKAAFLAIMVNVVLYTFFQRMTRKELISRLRNLLIGVERSGRGMVTVVSLLVCAQITIAMISLTGFGIKLSDALIGVSGNHVWLALILAACVSLILGMGIPTTAAYVLAASVVGPALQNMGVPALSAHMFMFYCALLSALTPPVCTAIFTAASIADAPWLRIAKLSIQLAIMKFILPFFFIYRPSILLMGKWYAIIETVVMTLLSSLMFAVGTVGYYRSVLPWPVRIFILATAAILIIPGVTADAIGLGGFVLLLVWQRVAHPQTAVLSKIVGKADG